MPDQYALVGPNNVVARIEGAAVVDPTVQTKAGWRWLPVEHEAEPAASPLERRA